MTNREALLSLFTFPVEAGLVDKSLLDHAIEPEGTYTAQDRQRLNLAAVDILTLLKQVTRLQEGDLSVTVNPQAVDSLIQALSPQTQAPPTIKNSGNLW